MGLAPTELRDRLVNVYLANFRRTFGVSLKRELVERQVIADLELTAAARASGDLREVTRPKRPPPRPTDRRIDTTPDVPRSAARSADAPVDFAPAPLFGNPMATSERWALACGRIARITEGTGIAATHSKGAETAECPELARRFADHFAWYLLSRNPNAKADPNSPLVRLNPYWGMTDGDAARAFMRSVEDICDASSGRLGPWRVPH